MDEEKGKEWSESAEAAPVQVRFHNGVPVVKVVISAGGNQVFIREFGPEGELLRSTVGLR